MENCSFCEELKMVKDINDYYRDTRSHRFEHRTEYRAALVQEDFCGDEPCGRVTGKSHELNFCPVCGRSFKEGTYEYR